MRAGTITGGGNPGSLYPYTWLLIGEHKASHKCDLPLAYGRGFAQDIMPAKWMSGPQQGTRQAESRLSAMGERVPMRVLGSGTPSRPCKTLNHGHMWPEAGAP